MNNGKHQHPSGIGYPIECPLYFTDQSSVDEVVSLFSRLPRAHGDTCAEKRIGVIVGAVNEVLDIPASEIEPVPEFGARICNDFVKGMDKSDGKFVVVLDLDSVMSVDESVVVAGMGRMETPMANA